MESPKTPIKKESSNPIFKCPQCTKCFGFESTLQKHILNSHEIKEKSAEKSPKMTNMQVTKPSVDRSLVKRKKRRKIRIDNDQSIRPPELDEDDESSLDNLLGSFGRGTPSIEHQQQTSEIDNKTPSIEHQQQTSEMESKICQKVQTKIQIVRKSLGANQEVKDKENSEPCLEIEEDINVPDTSDSILVIDEADKSKKVNDSLKKGKNKKIPKKVSSRVRKFTCEECNGEFNRKSDLKIHGEQVHASHPTKWIRRKCSRCSFKTSNNALYWAHDLVEHNIHNRHRFFCGFPTCWWPFQTLNEKQSHERDKHGGIAKTYHCNLCPKSFENEKMLSFHRKKCVNRRVYRCPLCPSQYIKKFQSLARHIQSKHQKDIFDFDKSKYIFHPHQMTKTECIDLHDSDDDPEDDDNNNDDGGEKSSEDLEATSHNSCQICFSTKETLINCTKCRKGYHKVCVGPGENDGSGNGKRSNWKCLVCQGENSSSQLGDMAVEEEDKEGGNNEDDRDGGIVEVEEDPAKTDIITLSDDETTEKEPTNQRTRHFSTSSINEKNAKKLFICPWDNKKFQNSAILHRHFHMVHLDNGTETLGLECPIGEDNFVCICNHETNCRDSFVIHANRCHVNLGIKPSPVIKKLVEPSEEKGNLTQQRRLKRKLMEFRAGSVKNASNARREEEEKAKTMCDILVRAKTLDMTCRSGEKGKSGKTLKKKVTFSEGNRKKKLAVPSGETSSNQEKKKDDSLFEMSTSHNEQNKTNDVIEEDVQIEDDIVDSVEMKGDIEEAVEIENDNEEAVEMENDIEEIIGTDKVIPGVTRKSFKNNSVNKAKKRKKDIGVLKKPSKTNAKKEKQRKKLKRSKLKRKGSPVLDEEVYSPKFPTQSTSERIRCTVCRKFYSSAEIIDHFCGLEFDSGVPDEPDDDETIDLSSSDEVVTIDDEDEEPVAPKNNNIEMLEYLQKVDRENLSNSSRHEFCPITICAPELNFHMTLALPSAPGVSRTRGKLKGRGRKGYKPTRKKNGIK